MQQVQAKDLDALLRRLHDNEGKNPALVDVLGLAEVMLGSIQSFFQTLDTSIYSEFRDIARYIKTAKTEIGRLQPNSIRSERIPDAGKELDAVVKSTEDATNTIMEQAEIIMAADPSDIDAYQATVNDAVMEIFQACSFQDITGQRISKVVNTLKGIEERVARLVEAFGIDDEDYLTEEELEKQRRADENLLHGPQLSGQGVDQADVDALLSGEPVPEKPAAEAEAESGETAGQDDVDALFAEDKPAKKSGPAAPSFEEEGESNSQADIDALFD